MGKREVLNKAIDFAKDKLKETAIEISKDAADKLKNKAIDVTTEAVEQLSNQAIGFIENKKESGKNKEIVINEAENIPKDISIKDIKNNISIKNNMTEAEEKKFLDNLTSSLINVGLPAIRDPKQALEIVKTLIFSTGEVAKFQELQITKRAEIERIRQQALAKIDMQKTLLMTYLEKTFDERKEIFKQHFKVVDDALAKGNMQQLVFGLDMINNLANSSPFKYLANIENVKSDLNDENKEWDF